MTDDFKELREALDAGPTDGPWEFVQGYDNEDDTSNSVGTIKSCATDGAPYLARVWADGPAPLLDAKFIAAANPAVIRSLLGRLEAAERDAERPPKIPNRIPLPHQSACDIEYSSGFDMGYAQGWNEAIAAMKEQQP